MTPYIRTLRALTAAVFQRVYRPVVWVIGGIGILLYIAIIWLALQVSSWWWLLLVVLIPVTIIVIIVALVLWTLSQKLLPRALLPQERKALTRFADNILEIAEVRATPLPLVAFFIAKDVVRGKKSAYIEKLLNDSSGLKAQFLTIRDMFR